MSDVNWRRITVVVLVAFGLAVAVWATRPWSDTTPLVAPPGVKQPQPDTVKSKCGAPWGGASVKTPPTIRPVVGTPCGGRSERRRLALFDDALAAVGIVGVTVARRSRDTATA